MASNGTMKESLSLEETNKLRISMGLKPLTANAPATLTEDQKAEQNFSQYTDRLAKERQAQELQTRLEKARNKRELRERLGGQGLGDGTEDDLKSWLKGTRKRTRQKEADRLEAEKKAAEEERKRLLEAENAYTDADLKGLKVSHAAQDFTTNSTTILTLADARVLDDSNEDTLENVNMAEYERTAEYLEKKKKSKQVGKNGMMEYRPWEEEERELEEYKNGILNKYDDFVFDGDEGLVGKKREKGDGFVIGSIQMVDTKENADDDENVVHLGTTSRKVDRKLLELNYDKQFHDDYLKDGDIGFKKPKKKKKRSARVKIEVDDPTSMSNDIDMQDVKVSTPAPIVRKNLDEENLVDDDELQLSLARQRRQRNKNRLKNLRADEDDTMSNGMPEHGGVVKIKPEDNAALPVDQEEGDVDDTLGGLVFDDTSDFIGRVGILADSVSERPSVPRFTSLGPRNGAVSPHEPEDEKLSEIEEGEVAVEEAMDVEMHQLENGSANIESVKEEENIGTAAEQLVSNGMAATLNLLRHQGLVKPMTPEELDRDQAQRRREVWTREQRKLDEEREAQRAAAKAAGNSKDQHQREIENRMREQERARKQTEMFKDYKPVVDIKYHDEFGRDLTQKEAWKALSHKFHGKGSGKMKTEKRLKKIEEERKREAMASGDTPLSTAAAFAARQEKTGKAIMILSVGNKQSAPQAEQTLPSNLNKPSTSNKVPVGTSKPKTKISKETPILTNLNPPVAALQAASTPISTSPAPSGLSTPATFAFKPVPKMVSLNKKPVGGGGETTLTNKIKIGLKRKEPDTPTESMVEREAKK